MQVFRILVGAVRDAIEGAFKAMFGFAGGEVVEMNVRRDHVHPVVMIPPKVAVSELPARLKGQTLIKLFNKFREMKKKPYWGNLFWAKSFYLGTVGLGANVVGSTAAF